MKPAHFAISLRTGEPGETIPSGPQDDRRPWLRRATVQDSGSTAFPQDERLRAKDRPEIDAESRAYKTWLDTIPGARLIVTHDSGHNVPIEQPQLVVETIREIVRAARDRPRQ